MLEIFSKICYYNIDNFIVRILARFVQSYAYMEV